MAYCPECKGEMSATAIQCPHCDYGFPSDDSGSRSGFAYSGLADLTLIVSIIAGVIGVFFTAIATIVSIIQGEWLIGLGVGPIALLLQLRMLVVFLRVQDLSNG